MIVGLLPGHSMRVLWGLCMSGHAGYYGTLCRGGIGRATLVGSLFVVLEAIGTLVCRAIDVRADSEWRILVDFRILLV